MGRNAQTLPFPDFLFLKMVSQSGGSEGPWLHIWTIGALRADWIGIILKIPTFCRLLVGNEEPEKATGNYYVSVFPFHAKTR